jgi:TetR/AcrR family transcriptional repressor of nem operon
MSAEETKTRLLETALELIWQSNYNSVGVNEICKQAGVTKGGFYHHFESKASLFCAASEYYWQSIKRDLDELLSPANTPLEQLENLIQFIFRTKFGDDPSTIRGCPFFSAGLQTGCEDSTINDNLYQMSQNCVKYNLALVRALSASDYLEGQSDSQRVARLLSQYVQGVSGYARVSRCECMETLKLDVAEAFYRLLGLKREYWFSVKPTWSGETAALAGVN